MGLMKTMKQKRNVDCSLTPWQTVYAATFNAFVGAFNDKRIAYWPSRTTEILAHLRTGDTHKKPHRPRPIDTFFFVSEVFRSPCTACCAEDSPAR